MRPTGRDLEILLQVYKHRYVRSSHLTSRIEGSCQGTLRRLLVLYHHGYLDRPHFRRQTSGKGGSDAFVYGLGDFGARILKEVLPLHARRLQWLSENPHYARESLEHTLMVTDIMIQVEKACRAALGVRFLEPGELADQVFGAAPDRPARFRWQSVVTHRGMPERVEVVPDQVFGIEFVDRVSRPQRIIFFLEADRGTMPVKRKDLQQSSIHRKLLAYHASWRQSVPDQLFGFTRYRVLTVTSSKARLAHLTEASQQFNHGQGSGLFLFKDYETFKAHPNILEMVFQSGRRNLATRLIEN